MVPWNVRGGAAALLLSVVEQSSPREQRALLAGCPGLGPCSKGATGTAECPARSSSSVCRHCVGHCCQQLLQEERGLLPCTASVWISPEELVLVWVRILEFSAFLVRFGGFVFFLK